MGGSQLRKPVSGSRSHTPPVATPPDEWSQRPLDSSLSEQRPHGGNTDPNEIRRLLAASQGIPGLSTHSGMGPHPDSKPDPHGGNTDPNEVRRKLASAHQSSNPSSPSDFVHSQKTTHVSQSEVGYSPPIQQWSSISPSSNVPSQMGPQQSYFNQAAHTPQIPPNGYSFGANVNPPMVNMPAQTPGGSQNLISLGYNAPSHTYPVNKELGSDLNGQAEANKYYQTHHQRGHANIFHEKSMWRGKWPNWFQLAGIPLPGTRSRHRDIMQRAEEFDPNDYYLSPTDGHLAKLYVQCTQEIFDADSNSTWRRTYIRNRSPLMLRAANWVLESIPNDREASGSEVAAMVVKWPLSCVLILLLMTYPLNVSGEVRNGGKYDVFPYKFWGYPYHARNFRDDKQAAIKGGRGPSQSSSLQMSVPPTKAIAERSIEPMFLCFLNERDEVEICDVQKWKREHGKAAKYVFVSYTSEQFPSDEDQLLLHDIGLHAAKMAKVPAYWVGCACLGDETQLEENVLRISDVIRGSCGVVIVVSNNAKSGVNSSEESPLQQWGSRVWTLPEVLLSPKNESILVYSRGGDIERPEKIEKRNFATVWADAPVARQLIDHFEGSLILSPMELSTIALRCLYSRQKGDYLKGDMSYALMGLMRKRPTIVASDSAFQAFARLSLANDSDMLLERLICIQPKSQEQAWYDMDDQFGVSLSDIYPTTQICGIGEDDTVLIDGAYAAAIRWKSFAHVATLVKDSWRRFFLRYAFRTSSYWFIVGVSLLAEGATLQSSPYIGIGAILLTFALLFLLPSPYLIRILYTGKIWGIQPWFFGFEGYMDISTIERHIFGADMGHLKWSPAGSSLSIHEENDYHECIGQDPTMIPETAERVRQAVHAQMGQERIFTLVDTNTLTVTLFAAVRPPVAVVLCGSEGGMQRALLCSYEWSTQTLYRESVLRMETPVQEKMSRVGRLRFGFKRDGRFS